MNLDLRNEKINRKIAESEQKKIPYALVIGNKEIEEDSVAVREHGKGDIGMQKVSAVKELFEKLNEPGAQ